MLLNREILCWDFSQRKGSVYEHMGKLTDTNEQLHLNRPTISMLMWWFFSARRLWHSGNVACAAPENGGSNEVGIMALTGDHVWLAPSQHLDSQFTACAACTSAASGRAWAPHQPGHGTAVTELCGVAGDPANPSPHVSSSPRLQSEPPRTLRGPWCEVRQRRAGPVVMYALRHWPESLPQTRMSWNSWGCMHSHAFACCSLPQKVVRHVPRIS